MEIVIIILILVVDQITKFVIQNNISLQSIEVIHNFFYIHYLRNTGAAWSMLSGYQMFLCLIAAIAIGVMVYFLRIAKSRHLSWTTVALSMMIAGAAGNLIDRLVFQYVRDFLDFYPFGYNFPVFNVADMALTIGVIILIIGMLKGEDVEKKEKA